MMHTSTDPVDEMLDVVRAHLGMDIAFVSRFEGGRRVFRHVSSGEPQADVRVGDGHDLESTYCTRIVSGSLAPLIADARLSAEVADLSITRELGIRAYAGVPISLPDGTVYGTLCAFSRETHDFRQEDAHALELAAALIAHRLEQSMLSARPPGIPDDRALMGEALGGDVMHMVFQPVVALRSGTIQGFEALARFSHEQIQRPEDWFALARRLGLDVELQRDAVAKALHHLADVPAGEFLSVNLSDTALLDDEVRAVLAQRPADRLVIEITEHEPGGTSDELLREIADLRDDGVRIALDDVGSGYAGLERILTLAPEFIKLDRALVVGIWDDAGRQAMVQALTTFARAVDAEVIAEGIEQQADADALRILGVGLGQGFLLGRPGPHPGPAHIPG